MGGCKRKGDHMLTAKSDLYLIVVKHWKTSFEKKLFFSAWASTLNMGLINKRHIPQAKNIPYQPLLIKPIFNDANLSIVKSCIFIYSNFYDNGFK